MGKKFRCLFSHYGGGRGGFPRFRESASPFFRLSSSHPIHRPEKRFVKMFPSLFFGVVPAQIPRFSASEDAMSFVGTRSDILGNAELSVTSHRWDKTQEATRILERDYDYFLGMSRELSLNSGPGLRLRESCRQSQAEVFSKSMNKNHKTWGSLLAEPCIALMSLSFPHWSVSLLPQIIKYRVCSPYS